MICAACGTDNREGRRFCLHCGSVLEAGCPACGAGNEPGARFCGDCGTALAVAPMAARPTGSPLGGPSTQDRAAAVAERRVVTVLFADLVGFTPFAEERDPEQVRETLSRWFEIAREAIDRYGGTVEKFIGDAVMAVWGTPVAHEDDAERAVRAALDLDEQVASLGPGIQARAGVLSGEVAVTVGATGEGLVAGDLVNTASRLQSVAPEGAVLVGESTMHATSAAIAYEAVGDQALKGKQAPVPAWRALRVVAQRRGAGRSEAPETPFVGRREELRLLKDQLHLTGRDPRIRLASITGPAGIGKSRLAWELEKYTDGLVERIWWHRGRSPAYGEGVTFWALGEMVRGRARLADTDDEATTRERIAATVEELVEDEREREWIASALLALLAVEPMTAGGRETLFAAWRRFFESIAAHGTTVLVFEDLQWADPGLLDFIDHLLDWSRSAPILVITLARPELFERRPDLGAGRRTVTLLPLEPLTAPEMRELLAGLVPDLPGEAAAAIVERADGIPLYGVEMVRAMLTQGRLRQEEGGYRLAGGDGRIALPETLRSLITSRLDALAPEDRSLLQVGSVLGQTFTLDALAEVGGADQESLGPRLRDLARRQLLTIEVDPRSPERGHYAFMQSLVREVAYATLARADRRALHLAAARHFERVGTDEIASLLASHYVAAYETSAEGPERDAVAAQARVALRAAADRAASLGSHEQAVSYLHQALAVTAEPADRAALLERAARSGDLAGHHDRAAADAREAIALYGQVGEGAGRGRTQHYLGMILIHSSRIGDAVAAMTAAVEELPDDADPETHSELLATLAWAQYRNLDPSSSLESADRALIIAERHHLRPVVARAMVTKGTALNFLHRPLECAALLREGIRLARSEGDTTTALRGMANVVSVVGPNEGPAAALAITRDAIDLAETVGDLSSLVWQLGSLAVGTMFAGDPLTPVLERMDEVLARPLEAADRTQVSQPQLILRVHRGDDVDDAVDRFEAEALAMDDPQTAAGVFWLRHHQALARGDHRHASVTGAELARNRPSYQIMPFAVACAVLGGDMDAARSLLPEMHARPKVTLVDSSMRLTAEAAVMAAEGRLDESLSMFRRAVAMLADVPSDFVKAFIGLVMVRTLGPGVPEARAAAERSLAIYERMGAGPLARQVLEALGIRDDSPVGPGRLAQEAPADSPIPVGESDRGI